MVLKITKETWKKCGIKALYYYIKKKRTLELWLKMGDIEIELGHQNIAVVLKRIRKFLGKKDKTHCRRSKTTIQSIF